MKTILIASTKSEKRQRLGKLLHAVNCHSFEAVSSVAEIASFVREEREGILIVASMNISALSEIDHFLPTGWDIIAILPSGMPQPFYSSALTVLNAPVSRFELSETISQLSAYSVFKKTDYGETKSETIAKAKNKLMREKHTDENFAHRYLQKKSMESGKSIFEIAKEILCN